MKPHPTFDEIAQGPYHNDPYGIDFTTNEERKVKRHDHFTVYENGTLVIHDPPYYCHNAPGERSYLRDKYGIEFRLLKDCTGMTFFTPEQEPVKKAHIDNASILLLDRNHGMALAQGHHRTYNKGHSDGEIRYYGPHARPLGGRPITVAVPDKRACAEYMTAIADTLRLAETYYTLKSADGGESLSPFIGIHGYRFGEVRGVIESRQVIPTKIEGQEPLIYRLGFLAARHPVALRNFIVSCTRRTTVVPYLYFKEKS